MILTMVRGDTRTFTITVKNPDGSAYDLTSCFLWFSVRQYVGASGYVFQKTLGNGITVDDPLTGVATVTVDPTDTAGLPSVEQHLRWDVQIKTGALQIFTLNYGELIIAADITTEVS
jgi:hypothetical protein